MKLLRLLLMLVMIIATSASVQAKKVLLKYKLEPGMEITLLHSLNQEVVQEVMGQSQVIEFINTTRYLFKILEKTNEGYYLIELQADGMKMKMENDFMNIDYDSDRDEEPPADLKSMAAGLHIPVKFLLNTKGEIVEVTEAEQYLSVMAKALEGVEGPMKQMMAGVATQSTSIEGLKNLFGRLFFNYPEGKVKIGDSWIHESESMQMVKFKNIIENTLVEANKKEATIKQTVRIEQLEMGDGMEMQGMSMKFELSGTKDAGYQLDVETGLIIKLDAVTNISGIISIESPQLPSPMSIPMTIKMTESLEQLK